MRNQWGRRVEYRVVNMCNREEGQKKRSVIVSIYRLQ